MAAPALDQQIGRIATATRLVVAMDFDGTLSRFAPIPDQARMIPAARVALEQLSECADTQVALLSGRAVDVLKHVANPSPKWLLIGSHGLEIPAELGATNRITSAMRSALDELEQELSDLSNQYPGTLVERKPAGVSFHTRAATGDVSGAIDRAESLSHAVLLPDQQQWLTRRSDMLIEFAATAATKADGIHALRSGLHPDAIFFAGDDGTDEDAMAALSTTDLSVRIGTQPSHADIVVPNQDVVVAALGQLAKLRSALTR